MHPPITDSPKHTAAWTFGFVALLLVAWSGAWVLERALEPDSAWLANEGGQFAYWTAMKLLLWVLPSLVLIRFSGRRISDVIGFGRLGAALLWGGGIGGGLALLSIAANAIANEPVFPSSLSWALVNIVIVAPIVEEITFRGAVLGTLMIRSRFVTANTVAALLFTVSHMPGWYFQGNLAENLSKPIGGALTIFIVGWLFGLVVYKSRSLVGGILTHSLNNLFS